MVVAAHVRRVYDSIESYRSFRHREYIDPISTRGAVPGVDGAGLEGSAVSCKKRKCRAPMGLGDMINSSFSCCRNLQCVESFSSGSGDLPTLKEEQAIVQTAGKQGRSEFIRGQIPLVKPRKNGGPMLAGGQLVCNAFFARLSAYQTTASKTGRTTLVARHLRGKSGPFTRRL